ncbi:reverse transcriptase and RNase H [Colletotrichum higginsianum IMI 349063]|uniref:Reverse transcriptase and RNase H n=1 Tax=Colletotrichum higginsianum (strain IMI 349063) TaxID=759273 RepID=A0A1B7XQV4_COLHI|nr:reverse transcriptase and RNase H [Colletotrichum higginsianum IMI 349063]OBR02139.1 reverse transcriptase and RNase H [Colletotrichum higginsianum IMI 349063]
MAEQHCGTQQNALPLDWSSWSVGPSTTSRLDHPFFNGCDDSQPTPPYYYLPPPGFSSTFQHYSDEPETPRHEESSNPDKSTEVLSSPGYSHLEDEKRFILNARLSNEPWKVTKGAYKNRFKSFPSKAPNVLSMRVDPLKKKYPEVKDIPEQSNIIIEKAERSVKRKKGPRPPPD